MLQNYRNLQICEPRFFLRVFHRTFSLYFWTAFLDFCVFVFVSLGCPLLYYFAREHWWYCVTVFLRTDWLHVSLLLFQIWYLANWIFGSLFPNTQGAVTRFNPYEFLIIINIQLSPEGEVNSGFASRYIQYRSKVSWQSRLDSRNSILASRRSRRSSFETRESRVENRESRIEGREMRSSRIFMNSNLCENWRLISRRKTITM